METDTVVNPTPKKLAHLLDKLLENEWGFLDEPWATIQA